MLVSISFSSYAMYICLFILFFHILLVYSRIFVYSHVNTLTFPLNIFSVFFSTLLFFHNLSTQSLIFSLTLFLLFPHISTYDFIFSLLFCTIFISLYFVYLLYFLHSHILGLVHCFLSFSLTLLSPQYTSCLSFFFLSFTIL